MKIMPLSVKQPAFKGCFQVLGDDAERQFPEIVKEERIAAGLEGTSTNIKNKRAWRYWDIEIQKPLPFKEAAKLNKEAGETVRAFGFAGGMELEIFLDWAKEGVNRWHVDTEEGLKKLVSILKKHLKK